MTFSGVLLAGGESRRMGRDKATLDFRGRPLWQHQLETLRSLEPVEVFVSARQDPPWRPNDVAFVADDPPSRGPLSGLVAALQRTQTTHLLALAVDMPFMTASFLGSFIALAKEGRGVISKIGKRFEPLAAIYPRDACRDLETALRGGDFSLQAVVPTLVDSAKLLTLETAGHVFRNLNEPADLKSER